MNIKIPENLNADLIMRRSSYGFLSDRRSGQNSYVRRMGSGFYPRFHVYLEGGMIKLHLDQKQASYEGYRAHSGEHDGEVVEREIARIQGVIDSLQTNQSHPAEESNGNEEKSGFWGSLFG